MNLDKYEAFPSDFMKIPIVYNQFVLKSFGNVFSKFNECIFFIKITPVKTLFREFVLAPLCFVAISFSLIKLICEGPRSAEKDAVVPVLDARGGVCGVASCSRQAVGDVKD